MPRTNNDYQSHSAPQTNLQEEVVATPPRVEDMLDLRDIIGTNPVHRPTESLPAALCTEDEVYLPVEECAWARMIFHMPPAFERLSQLAGILLTPLNRVYLFPGSVVLIRKDNILTLWIYLMDEEWFQVQLPHIRYETGWELMIAEELYSWVGLSYQHRIVRATTEAIHALRTACDKQRKAADRRRYRHASQHYMALRGRAITEGYSNAGRLAHEFALWFRAKCTLAGANQGELQAQIAGLCGTMERERAVMAALLLRMDGHLKEIPDWRRLPIPSEERDHIQMCAAAILRELGCTNIPETKALDTPIDEGERLLPNLRPLD